MNPIFVLVEPEELLHVEPHQVARDAVREPRVRPRMSRDEAAEKLLRHTQHKSLTRLVHLIDDACTAQQIYAAKNRRKEIT